MPRLDLVAGINLDATEFVRFALSGHVDPEKELLRRLESFVAHHGILEIDLDAKRADCGEI